MGKSGSTRSATRMVSNLTIRAKRRTKGQELSWGVERGLVLPGGDQGGENGCGSHRGRRRGSGPPRRRVAPRPICEPDGGFGVGSRGAIELVLREEKGKMGQTGKDGWEGRGRTASRKKCGKRGERETKEKSGEARADESVHSTRRREGICC